MMSGLWDSSASSSTRASTSMACFKLWKRRSGLDHMTTRRSPASRMASTDAVPPTALTERR